MTHSTHWWECYLMRMAVCILGTVQVQCLTTDIAPTPDDPNTSSHNALILEISQIVPSATRREPVPSSEQLRPTPEFDEVPPPPTTTTTHHLGHQPLPSSSHHFFPTSIDDAVIPPHHAPMESLVTAETDSELSESFTTELSDILIQGTHISNEMYSQKMLSQNMASQDMGSQEMRSHITPSQDMYSHITDSHAIHSHATDSYVIHSQVTDSQVLHSRVTDSQALHSRVTDSQVLHSRVTDSQFLHSRVTDSQALHSQVADSHIMSSHDIHKIRSMLYENTHNDEMHSHIMHSRNMHSNDLHKPSMQEIHSSREIHGLDAQTTRAEISPSHQLIESTPSLPTASPSRYSATSVPASFHTPLMSLLMASSTLPSFPEASSTWHGLLRNNNHHQQPTSTNTSDDSVMLSNAQVFESDNRKLLMLVLRAEDCQKFNKADFERMLSSLLERYGFADAVPQVSTAKCYSHLSINLTLNSSVPTLRFLPNVDSKSNVTVDVLNRTFRIVKLEKVDLMLQRPSRHNATVIAAVTRHESVAYIALGVCFGLIVLACLSICCLKLCCWPAILQPKKRLLKKYPKSGNADDYVLTPLPRAGPSHLQDPQPQASTSSAAESALKAPSEDLVVQASDTSIVPMVTDPATESEVVVKDSSGDGDMTERNNVKNAQGDVSSGVANPTFERY